MIIIILNFWFSNFSTNLAFTYGEIFPFILINNTLTSMELLPYMHFADILIFSTGMLKLARASGFLHWNSIEPPTESGQYTRRGSGGSNAGREKCK